MATTQVNWRAAASPEDLREYDAFGPWVDPVTDEQSCPPRFRPFYAELQSARLVLKVPRDVDRADARPGQDLYRAIVAAFDDHLTVLTLDSGTVSRRDAPYSAVVAISTYTNLLFSVWSVMLRDGTRVAIEHNTTGAGNFVRLTELVRAGLGPDVAARPSRGEAVSIGDVPSRRLRALAGRLGTATPEHTEGRNHPCREARGRLRLSNGLVIAAAPADLVLLGAGEASRPLFMPNYATEVVEVPYRGLNSYQIDPPIGRSSFHQLVLIAGAQRIVQPCLRPPEQVAAELESRGVSVARPVLA